MARIDTSIGPKKTEMIRPMSALDRIFSGRPGRK